jgi:acetolactate decarboxylase
MRYLFQAFLLALVLAGSLHATESHMIFQTSTQALMDGVYDGNMTFQELGRHGDFGIGTFNGLDGEMIGLDGKFYQIKADGRVSPVAGTMKTPLAEVTLFKAGKTYTVEKSFNYDQLTGYITTLLPSPNLLYAIKIEGFFPYVKTRSVPRQHKPYPPLAEVAKKQSEFEFTNVKGVIVAFRYPQYLGGINLAGYHCHFITADRQGGGHLLDCRVERASIALDIISNLDLRLPQTQEFLGIDLSKERRHELERVEKSSVQEGKER